MMNIKDNIIVYNEYLKIVNEVSKEIKHIESMKKKILRKDHTASESNVEIVEKAAILSERGILETRSNKIYNFTNGDRYIGKIKFSKMNGSGVYTFYSEDNQKLEYMGQFKDNLKDGKGQYIFPNNNKYIGYFKDDMIEGIGQMIYANGDEYIGNWKRGKKNGDGIFKWSDGCVYYGGFKENKMDGEGVCYGPTGILLYKGQWKGNQIHGKGTYIWDENKKYIGEFRNGKKHGSGKFYLNGELVYEGTWKFDKPSIFGRSLEEIFTVKF